MCDSFENEIGNKLNCLYLVLVVLFLFVFAIGWLLQQKDTLNANGMRNNNPERSVARKNH